MLRDNKKQDQAIIMSSVIDLKICGLLCLKRMTSANGVISHVAVM